MPQCFRCGKMMCNEQALNYHLNKQVPCTCACKYCNEQFSSKALFKNHILHCSLGFDLDSLVDIIGVLEDTNCIYLIDDLTYKVKASSKDSRVQVGDSFFKDLDPSTTEHVLDSFCNACELTTSTCTIKRAGISNIDCKLNVISYLGNTFLLVRETT